MKKTNCWIAIVLALLMVMSGMAVAEEKTEVVMWSTLSGTIGEALQDIVNAYNESQSTYFVNYIYSGNYNDTNAKLVSSGIGNRPDICVAAIERIPYFVDNADLLVPVQKYIEAESYDMSDFVSCMASTYTDAEGNWLAMPLGNSAVGIWYNVDLLAQVGYTPEMITSAEAVFDCSAKLVEAGLVEYGAAWDAGSVYVTYPISQQGIQILNNDNGKSAVADATRFSQDEALREQIKWYFETVQNATRDGIICSFDVAGADRIQMFVDGKIGFYANTIRGYSSIEGAKTGELNYGFNLLQTMKNGAEYYGGAPGGPGMFICNNEAEEKEAGAWDFFKFYAESEYVEKFAMKSGYLPVTNSGYNSETYQAFVSEQFPDAGRAFQEQMAATEKCDLPSVANYADYHAVINEYVKLVASDLEYDIDTAVEDFIYAIDESLMLYMMQK